jgi:hypothetical protein
MSHQDYSHRDVVDKLGVQPGHALAFVEAGWQIDSFLRERVLARAGRPPADPGEGLDLALVAVDGDADLVEVLGRWKDRVNPAGGIWLLTPKRGQPGYVREQALIAAGQAAGLVDNKVCSVSETTSAMRFVIRRTDQRRKEGA